MKKQSGFTLIELLVVMFILGILLAIALPAFFKNGSDNPTPFVQPAKQEYCQNRPADMRQSCRLATFGANRHSLYCSEMVLMPDPEIACIRSGKVWAFPFSLLGKIESDFAEACFSSSGSQPNEVRKDVRAYRIAVEERVDAGFDKPGFLPMDEMDSLCDLSRDGGTTAGVAISP